MAQNGDGGVSTRRIHASTAVASRLAAAPLPHPTAAAVPLPTTAVPPRRPERTSFVTLGQPRPDVARKQNEYIETPLRPHKTFESNNNNNGQKRSVPDVVRHTRPILKQPSSVTTFKKDVIKPSVVDGSDASSAASSSWEDDEHDDSIICAECGRCKCESCRSPKRLPSKWLCRNGCLFSADSIVDYASCMCCVKGLFYHCANMDADDGSCAAADRPCSCVPHRRILRWTTLSFISLLLPCLCCYWPFRGCVEMCELCYSKVTNHGCNCSAKKPIVSNKGLL